MPVIERVWRSGPRHVKRTAWGYTVQIDGKQVRAFNAAWSKDDAQQAMAARMLERDAPPPPSAPALVTFQQMIERYLREKTVSRKKTIKNDREALARFRDFFGADARLTAITAPRIAEYRLARLTMISPKTHRKLEPGSVNRELSILRGLLRMAADPECGFLERVPRIRYEREPQGRLRFLSEDEVRRLLVECQRAATHPVSSCRCPHLYAAVVVALNTGMRRGEVLGLTWRRVDFSRSVLQLEETKNGTRREISMNRAVYDVLSTMPRTGEKLFPTKIRLAFVGLWSGPASPTSTSTTCATPSRPGS